MVTNCEFCAFYVYDDDGYAALCIHFPLPAQKTAKKEKSSGSP